MSFPGMALQRCWHLVDAQKQTVGRVASQVANILRGKHKPTFLPNKDMGDHVVVINAEKIKFSGTKWKTKLYRWHTGYPGGLKQRTAEEMLEKNPTMILRKAILGMLKRTKLRHQCLEPRLFLYAGPDHAHAAQLSPRVPPLPRAPARLGRFHFGLDHYAHPHSYLEDHVTEEKQAKRDAFRKWQKEQRQLEQQQEQQEPQNPMEDTTTLSDPNNPV